MELSHTVHQVLVDVQRIRVWFTPWGHKVRRLVPTLVCSPTSRDPTILRDAWRRCPSEAMLAGDSADRRAEPLLSGSGSTASPPGILDQLGGSQQWTLRLTLGSQAF